MLSPSGSEAAIVAIDVWFSSAVIVAFEVNIGASLILIIEIFKVCWDEFSPSFAVIVAE